jgi:3-oxoacyl-[acyl-carrier protein] reductase
MLFTCELLSLSSGPMKQALSKEKGISAAEAEALMVADSGITEIGEPEDVANLVVFIVSSQNRYLHGALMDLDGGATKTM